MAPNVLPIFPGRCINNRIYSKEPFLLFTFILNNLKHLPHFHKLFPLGWGTCLCQRDLLLGGMSNYLNTCNYIKVRADPREGAAVLTGGEGDAGFGDAAWQL